MGHDFKHNLHTFFGVAFSPNIQQTIVETDIARWNPPAQAGVERNCSPATMTHCKV
jgi:hypothetical protein